MSSLGRFFVFEGIDGVGKTTQQDRFVAWLKQQGLSVVTCRDPGSTPLGESLRRLLLERDTVAVGHRAELLLYMAARAQLVDDVIRPALAAGKTVLSDRFVLSTLAYQAYAHGLDLDAAREIGRFTIDGCQPDLVFLLDLDPHTAAQRRTSPDDRIESRGLEYLARVREGFLAEAAQQPQRVVVIDASGNPDDVQAQIRAAANRVLEVP